MIKNLVNEYKVLAALLAALGTFIAWNNERVSDGMASRGAVDSLSIQIDSARMEMRALAKEQVALLVENVDRKLRDEMVPRAEEVLVRISESQVKLEHLESDVARIRKHIKDGGYSEHAKLLEEKVRLIELEQAKEGTLMDLRRDMDEWQRLVEQVIREKKKKTRVNDNDSRTIE